MRSGKILPTRLEQGRGTCIVSRDFGKIVEGTTLHEPEKKKRDRERLCLPGLVARSTRSRSARAPRLSASLSGAEKEFPFHSHLHPIPTTASDCLPSKMFNSSYG